MSIGVSVLEFVAESILPTLAAEVGAYTLCRVASRVARRGQGTIPDYQLSYPGAVLHPVAATTVLSATRGRLRLKVAGLSGNYQRATELTTRLEQLVGVSGASVSTLTGNVLVQYDPTRTNLAAIRAALEPLCSPARRRTPRALIRDTRQLALVGI